MKHYKKIIHQVLLKLHSVCIGQLSKLEEYRETRTYRMKQQAVTAFEQQIQNSCRTSLARGNSGDEWTKKTVQRVRKEHQFEKNDLEKVDNSLNSAARKAVSSGFDALCEQFLKFLLKIQTLHKRILNSIFRDVLAIKF